MPAASPFTLRSCRALIAACLLSSLVSTTAHAAGAWPLERGVSNFGRGGANIVDPGDPIAMWINPAGLAGLDGLQLMVDVGIQVLNPRFKRADDDLDNDGTPTSYDEVNSRKWSVPSPGILAAWSLREYGVPGTVGLGVFAPLAGSNDWPASGPQRYSSIRGGTILILYALSAAFEIPVWKMRLGGTAFLAQPSLNTRLAFNLPSLASSPEDPRFDVVADFKAGGNFAMTGAFGFSMQPTEWLGLATSWQIGIPVSDTGTVDVFLGEQAELLGTVTGNRVRASTRLPSVVRAAVQGSHPDGLFDLEFAFVWEEWSAFRRIAVEPQDITFETSFGQSFDIPNFDITNGYRDTYSLRLGGSYRATDTTRLRGGLWYERSAVSQTNLSASALELDNIGGSLGLRQDFRERFWMDFAAGYKWGLETNVNNSQIFLIDLLQTPPAQLWPVANGRYRNWNLLFMAAFGVKFDV